MVIILIYVLLGICIYIIAIPIAEGLVNVILQWFEVIKGRQLLSISQIQQEISKLEKDPDEEKPHSRVIGFAIPDDDEEEDLEEEEEDYDD